MERLFAGIPCRYAPEPLSYTTLEFHSDLDYGEGSASSVTILKEGEVVEEFGIGFLNGLEGGRLLPASRTCAFRRS